MGSVCLEKEFLVVFGSSLHSSGKIQLVRNSFGAFWIPVLQVDAGDRDQWREHLTPNTKENSFATSYLPFPFIKSLLGLLRPQVPSP